MSNVPALPFSRLVINTSGEALRGLLALKIKEADRFIGLIANKLEVGRQELAEAEKAAGNQFERRMERQVLQNLGNSYGGVGVSEVQQAKQQLTFIESNLASLQNDRAQLQWFHDQIAPNTPYELGAADFALLGIGFGTRVADEFGRGHGVLFGG